MKPFRSTGWMYYDKVQEILPNAGARGRHAFSALSSTQFTISADPEEADDGPVNVASGSHGGGRPMDVDGAIATAGSVASGSSGLKRKFSALWINNDLTGDGSANVSTSPTSPAENPPRMNASKRAHSSKPSSSSPIGSTGASETRSRQRQPTKMTNTVVMSGIHGAINHLNDTLKVPAPHDSATIDRTKAVKHVLEQEMGLTHPERIGIVALMSENSGFVTTYLTIENDATRVDWIRAILARHKM
jgi:hypothetical protein